ncbi:MAG: barstar family protein [Labrys sp. (in: a-proteobacteria)]
MQPFVLTSNIASLRRESTRVLELPTALSDKDALLGWYAVILGIPEYFGANWDAFDECLRDLSWVKERRLVLFHRDVPIAANPKDRRIYLEVLANAATDWRPGEAHELIVAFDPACELKLHAAIRES